MQSEGVAVAWVLVIVLGLLLGLLLVVVAFGVARHLGRQRPKPDRRTKRPSPMDEDGDEPTEWRGGSGGGRERDD